MIRERARERRHRRGMAWAMGGERSGVGEESASVGPRPRSIAPGTVHRRPPRRTTYYVTRPRAWDTRPCTRTGLEEEEGRGRCAVQTRGRGWRAYACVAAAAATNVYVLSYRLQGGGGAEAWARTYVAAPACNRHDSTHPPHRCALPCLLLAAGCWSLRLRFISG
jgi:hypothetical protein